MAPSNEKNFRFNNLDERFKALNRILFIGAVALFSMFLLYLTMKIMFNIGVFTKYVSAKKITEFENTSISVLLILQPSLS